MTTKRIKRPRDPIALAKLIGDIATGQVEDRVEDDRDPRAVERVSRLTCVLPMTGSDWPDGYGRAFGDKVGGGDNAEDAHRLS